MKQWIRKISISLALAVAEMALGILLLINPMGLASMVMIALGILLVLLGLVLEIAPEFVRAKGGSA